MSFLNRLSRISIWRRMSTLHKDRVIDIHDLHVISVSAHFLVVNKSYDVVINDVNPERMSLYKQIAHKFPEWANFQKYQFGFGVVHRLDYSTSGVLVVPLTPEANKAAQKSFELRKATKLYLAIVRHHVKKNRFLVELDIGHDLREEWKGIKMCTSDKEYCGKPRKAMTKFVVLERGFFCGDPVTKVLLQPHTGRRHQLRVHCHEIGHTILGDFTYSERQDSNPERMFLHAHRLDLPNELEHLHVEAGDPFCDLVRVTEKVHQLQDAYRIFENEQMEWKT